VNEYTGSVAALACSPSTPTTYFQNHPSLSLSFSLLFLSLCVSIVGKKKKKKKKKTYAMIKRRHVGVVEGKTGRLTLKSHVRRTWDGIHPI
jgi:hypothetical protein